VIDRKQNSEPRQKPVPVKLSAEDLRRADAEASEWREAVQSGTAKLERVSAEDLQIRLR
jgi:hypothetical protein